MVYQSHPLAVLAKKHLRRVLEFKRRSDRFTSGDWTCLLPQFWFCCAQGTDRRSRPRSQPPPVGCGGPVPALHRCSTSSVTPRRPPSSATSGPDKARSPSSSAPSSTANGNGASVRPGASLSTPAALPSLLPQNEHQERWAFRIPRLLQVPELAWVHGRGSGSGTTGACRASVNYVVWLVRRRREAIGSRWRLLNPGEQALLALACLRKDETFTEIGTGFGAAGRWSVPRSP